MMPARRLSRTTVLKTGLVILCASIGSSPRAHAERAPLALTISAAKERPHVLGEPVVVRVELANMSSKRMQLSPDLQAPTQLASYHTSRDGERFERYDPGFALEPHIGLVDLAPGQSVHHDEMLYVDTKRNALLFSRAGWYYVRVDWEDPRSGLHLVSNILRLRFLAPQGQARVIYDAMLSPEVMKQIAYLSEDPGALETLKKIAKTDTVYAPYAAIRLAHEELSRNEFGLEIEIAQQRQHQRLQRAMVWLDLADRAGFPIRDHAVLMKGRAALDSGDRVEAAAYFARVRSEFPGSQAVDLAGKYLTSLQNQADLP